MISSMILTITGKSTIIALGTETVGQAQILTKFSKPFELAGLFGAADAGVFPSEEVTMNDDTATHEAEIVADNMPLQIPLK